MKLKMGSLNIENRIQLQNRFKAICNSQSLPLTSTAKQIQVKRTRRLYTEHSHAAELTFQNLCARPHVGASNVKIT